MWYEDPVKFFEDVFKFKPWSYQKEILEKFKSLLRIMCCAASDSIYPKRRIPIKINEEIRFPTIESIFRNSDVISNGREIYYPQNMKTLTKNGEWHKVNFISRHYYKGKIIKLREPKGKTIVTPNHSVYNFDGKLSKPKDVSSLYTLRNLKNKKNKEISIELNFPLENNYYVRNPLQFKTLNNKGEEVFRNHYYHEKLSKYFKEEKLKCLLKFLATYISEGSAYSTNRKSRNSTYKRYMITIWQKDKEWLESIQKDISFFFKGKKGWISKNYKNNKLYWSLNYDSKLLYSLCMKYCGSKDNKHLPSFLFELSEEYQKEFLEKYIEGDGSKYPSHFKISSKVDEIICGFSLLLSQMDIDFSIDKRGKDRVKTIRSVRIHHKNKLTKEEFFHEGYVYDINVEKYHEFVDAEGLVLVHNTGKTYLLACLCLWSATALSHHLKRPYNTIIISGTKEQAKYLYNYIREAIMDNPVLSRLVEDTLISETRFKNRSKIKAMPKSYTSIAGAHMDLVIIDEAAFPELDFFIHDALRIVSPTEHSRILLSSSPHEYESLFVQMWEDRKKYPDWTPENPINWKRFFWSGIDCPRTRAKLKEAENLPEDMYVKYWEGRPFIMKDTMIPIKALKKSMVEGLIAYDKGLIIFIGVDWGYGHPTGIIIVQLKGEIFEVLEYKMFKEETFEKIHKWIETKAKYYKASKIFVDGSDVGECQRLRNRGLPVFPIAFNKEKGYMQSRLRDLFIKNKIKIPESYQDLIQQLRTYTWSKKVNDDLVDALQLAVREESIPSSSLYYKIIKSRKR